MDEWQIMFGQVQSITRSNQSLQQNLEKLFEFVRRNPALFDDLEFWSRAEDYNFRPDFAVLADWAKQGFEALEPETGGQFLLLDLGDCPETFRLYCPGGQKRMSEEKFCGALSNNLIVSTSDMEECFGLEIPSPFHQLFGKNLTELSDHHVSELSGSIMDWTGNGSHDFHGNGGYLLWLMLGSLALIEPLRDKNFCKAILKGRDRLHLLSGYEEILFYAATITPEGISFDTAL